MPAQSDCAVNVSRVTTRFGRMKALDHVSLVIPYGSMFALCGLNGAGKTTLLRHCTGLAEPDEGDVHVGGIDVWVNPVAAKRAIGLVPDEPRLFASLTGRELLRYAGLLRQMPPNVIDERADDLLSLLDLRRAQDKVVSGYSLGMTKKIALACALLHAPKVLFLDEPFNAIDPVSAQAIERLLQRFVSAGSTVVFSSHLMDSVERLCDGIAILDHGQVVVAGTTSQVTNRLSLRDRFVKVVGTYSGSDEKLPWLAPAD